MQTGPRSKAPLARRFHKTSIAVSPTRTAHWRALAEPYEISAKKKSSPLVPRERSPSGRQEEEAVDLPPQQIPRRPLRMSPSDWTVVFFLTLFIGFWVLDLGSYPVTRVGICVCLIDEEACLVCFLPVRKWKGRRRVSAKRRPGIFFGSTGHGVTAILGVCLTDLAETTSSAYSGGKLRVVSEKIGKKGSAAVSSRKVNKTQRLKCTNGDISSSCERALYYSDVFR